MGADYEIKKSLLGRRGVAYTCPKCKGALESPLADAGKPDKCPVCTATFVVPGEAELRAERMAQNARNAQRNAERKAAEERKRREAEEKELAARRRSAQKDAKAQVHRNAERAEAGTSASVPKPSWIDRLFCVAFDVGRYFSAVVITLCLLTFVVGAIALVVVQPTAKPLPAVTVSDLKPPTCEELLAWVQKQEAERRRAEEASRATERKPEVRGGGERRSSQPPQRTLTPAQRVAAKHGISVKELQEAIDSLGSTDGPAFLAALDSFLTEWAEAGKSVKDKAGATIAFEWFFIRFATRLREREKEYQVAQARQEAVAAENQMARRYASERRWLTAQVLVGAFGVLIAFLALPLLLQIERNSRLTAAILCASSQGVASNGATTSAMAAEDTAAMSPDTGASTAAHLSGIGEHRAAGA